MLSSSDPTPTPQPPVFTPYPEENLEHSDNVARQEQGLKHHYDIPAAEAVLVQDIMI